MSQRLGRYRLISLLATGGMGEVFLARHEGPGGFSKTVVIKRILRHLATDQGFIDQFLNEARLTAQLQHPNIAQVFGLEREDDSWFISMEYVHGQSVRAIVDRARAGQASVPPAIAVRVCSQVLQGLHFAHELRDEQGRPLGILHRDVTPENVLVAYAGVVKLVDFGIAKAMSGASTRTGRPKGKLPYMAPELTLSGAVVDRRADVYGAGLLLRELLTLSPPGEGSLSSVAPPLVALIERATATSPGARFSSAQEFSRALEDWLTNSSGLTVLPDDVSSFLLALFGPEAASASGVVETAAPQGTAPLVLDAPPVHVTQQFRMPAVVAAPVPAAPAVVRARRGALVAGVLAVATVVSLGVGLVVRSSAPATHVGQRAGLVTLRVTPNTEVWLSGRRLGVTPMKAVEVPPGVAAFTLVHAGATKKVSVRVPAGGSVTLSADFGR